MSSSLIHFWILIEFLPVIFVGFNSVCGQIHIFRITNCAYYFRHLLLSYNYDDKVLEERKKPNKDRFNS